MLPEGTTTVLQYTSHVQNVRALFYESYPYQSYQASHQSFKVFVID